MFGFVTLEDGKDICLACADENAFVIEKFERQGRKMWWKSKKHIATYSNDNQKRCDNCELPMRRQDTADKAEEIAELLCWDQQ